MPKRGSRVHCGFAEAGRDLGLPPKKRQGLGETLVISQQAFTWPGTPSGPAQPGQDLDVQISNKAPTGHATHAVLRPGVGSLPGGTRNGFSEKVVNWD